MKPSVHRQVLYRAMAVEPSAPSDLQVRFFHADQRKVKNCEDESCKKVHKHNGI